MFGRALRAIAGVMLAGLLLQLLLAVMALLNRWHLLPLLRLLSPLRLQPQLRRPHLLQLLHQHRRLPQ